MTLSDTQFAVLNCLNEFGMKTAIEVLGPIGMDGKRKVARLEWNVANKVTLAKLEGAGFVSVKRAEPTRPADATGRLGHPRREISIEITDAGRAALMKEAS